MLAIAKTRISTIWQVLQHFQLSFRHYILQERDLGDEYGWKQVHGDVFRPASHSLLFSALIGAGHQLTTVIFSVIIFAILGELYTE